jgi:DNA primase large subunit
MRRESKVNLQRNKEMEFILNQLESKIKKCVRETVLDEREDLSQEMKLRIIEKLESMLDEEVPGFIEYARNI